MNKNIIISHEIMHHRNKKKGKLWLIAIKIDMDKSYDKVEWDVLLNILRCLGFEEKFISTSSFSILLNSSSHDLFSLSMGIRQGDPMSSALFTIFFFI